MEDIHSPRAILDYYFRPARPLHEAKVVLAGTKDVGKTSLIRRLELCVLPASLRHCASRPA